MDPKTVAMLPQYKSHKIVRAAKIVAVDTEPPGPGLVASLILDVEGVAPVGVDAFWIQSKKPERGGYLVVYDDGYMSWSPAKAFEDGYTALK